MATDREPEKLQVKLELNHKASFREKPTPENFTHDWKVSVRGPNDFKIENFVEKVIFYLHDSFKKPKRVVKEPPYSIAESGYAGFTLPIDVCFRNKDEPKKITFYYDLFLHAKGCPPVNNTRCEKLTFENPTPEFRSKLLKAGAYVLDSESVIQSTPVPTNSPPRLKPPSAELKKSPKKESSTSAQKLDQKFTDLFGAPIKTSESDKDRDQKTSSHSSFKKDHKDKKPKKSSKSEKEPQLKDVSRHETSKVTPPHKSERESQPRDIAKTHNTKSSHKSEKDSKQSENDSKKSHTEKSTTSSKPSKVSPSPSSSISDRHSVTSKKSSGSANKNGDKAGLSSDKGKLSKSASNSSLESSKSVSKSSTDKDGKKDKHHHRSKSSHSSIKDVSNVEKKKEHTRESDKTKMASNHSSGSKHRPNSSESKDSLKSSKSENTSKSTKTEDVARLMKSQDLIRSKETSRDKSLEHGSKHKVKYEHQEKDRSSHEKKKEEYRSRDKKRETSHDGGRMRSSSAESLYSKDSDKLDKHRRDDSKNRQTDRRHNDASKHDKPAKNDREVKLEKSDKEIKIDRKDIKRKDAKPSNEDGLLKKTSTKEQSSKTQSLHKKASTSPKELNTTKGKDERRTPKKDAPAKKEMKKPMEQLDSLFSTELSDEDPFDEYKGTYNKDVDDDEGSDRSSSVGAKVRSKSREFKSTKVVSESEDSDNDSNMASPPHKEKRKPIRENVHNSPANSFKKENKRPTPEAMAKKKDVVSAPVELEKKISASKKSSKRRSDRRDSVSSAASKVARDSKDSVSVEKKASERIYSSSSDYEWCHPIIPEPAKEQVSPARRNSDDIRQELIVSESDDSQSEHEPEIVPDVKSESFSKDGNSLLTVDADTRCHFTEDYLVELVRIQQKLMASRDRDLVQKVVDVVGETNCFDVDVSFNFDLCSLDRPTVYRIRDLLQS